MKTFLLMKFLSNYNQYYDTKVKFSFLMIQVIFQYICIES